MISAVIHNKSSRWFSKSIENHSNSEEKKIPREDEITSTIFGSMKYFNHLDVFKLFNSMCDEVDDRRCLSMNISLWPSLRILKNKKRVEPDAVFSFTLDGGEVKKFILEAKWLNNEYNYNQLENQWIAFGKNAPENTRLIYLATCIKNFNLYKKNINDKWRGITWSKFSSILSKMKCNDKITSEFFYDLHLMLEKFNFSPFTGFNHCLIKTEFKKFNLKIIKFPSNLPKTIDIKWSIYD
ncbi:MULTISPECIES: hypothetical protein [Providencia]|uniref:hypothetical protein n=1 Tax=Providencia TaxID=586 RepID=UPI00234AE705|nr:hypothetical protein [Providencia sp. PROV089]